MSTATALLDQVLNGLTIGIVFVLLAAGLSIIFGVMDVINFAHGELFALGAYFALAVVSATGPWGFLVALVVAPIVVGLVGAALERFTINPLYGRNPLYHILLTFGLVLIFKDVIEFVWGPQSYSLQRPPILSGAIGIEGVYTYPTYNSFVIVAGTLIAAGTWVALNYTRFGLVVRAGAQDREMVRHLGIDIDRYYTLVFAFGTALAAVAGIVLAGRQGIEPAMGDSVIIPAFVIVVLGGLGSFRGAVVGGLGVGLIQTMLRSGVVQDAVDAIPVVGAYLPSLSIFEGLVVFLLMILVLLVRPQGLFGNPEWKTSGEEEGKLLTGAGAGVFTDRQRFLAGAFLIALVAVLPLVLVVLDLVLATVGLSFGANYYANTVLVNVMIWGLFALSLDFVMGYAGLVSLGHVLFYGLGAYSTVLVVTARAPVIGPVLADLGIGNSVFVALSLGIVVAAVIAWVVGYLSIRVSGVYFAMITLAFAELFHSAVVKVPWTGSTDGIFGFDPVYGIGGLTLEGLFGEAGVDSIEVVGDVTLFYYFVLAAIVVSYLLARQLMRAPFGSVLLSIREAEQRASFLGYDTTAYKRRAFVVSGALAGLAGGLAAIHSGGVAPSFLEWIKSGEVIVMTMLGGMGTLYGPMLGAGVFFGVREVLLTYTEQWQGVLGLLFVLFVIFVPRGLVSVPAVIDDRLDSFGGGGGDRPAADPGSKAPEREVND